MVHREKLCNTCQKFFFYDDGLVVEDVTDPRNDGLEKITGYCPVCVDPHSVPGETYEKKTILNALKRHLARKDIDTTVLTEEILQNMLKEFPRANAYYNSNNTYKTFTLYTGTIFDGAVGQFELGVALATESPSGWIHYYRFIKCCRCNSRAKIEKTETLDYFLGLNEKYCRECDSELLNNFPEGCGGNRKSEFSARAFAKALNVSRNDFQRHPEVQYSPALPDGHIERVGGFQYKIIKSWWDEDPKSYSPKYLIECQKCKQQFEIVQKHLKQTTHYCP